MYNSGISNVIWQHHISFSVLESRKMSLATVQQQIHVSMSHIIRVQACCAQQIHLRFPHHPGLPVLMMSNDTVTVSLAFVFPGYTHMLCATSHRK